MPNKIFLMGGRTGGPLMPLLAIAKNLDNVEAIIIGVRNSFEQKISREQNLPIEFLPEAKFSLLTFKNSPLFEICKELLRSFWHLFLLSFSFCRCCFLLIKYKPKLILNSGSFLGVPMIFAAKVTNFLALTSTKVVIHQQDPLPGLANKLTIQLADLQTCVFEETKQKYPKFGHCRIIPNPLDIDKIEQQLPLNPDLSNFIAQKIKPLLLIYGGGSGAQFINNWTLENLAQITDSFRVLHLTGALQKEVQKVQNIDYLSLPFLFEEMYTVMKLADCVVCRAGMGSICELLYLQKPTFLVPIAASHQEINAKAVKNYFYTLEQKDVTNWLQTIRTNYPNFFDKITYPSQTETKEQLKIYYAQIQKLNQ